MKESIESIRIMLKDGLFKAEQQVRFSMRGKLCLELGWDVRNQDKSRSGYPLNMMIAYHKTGKKKKI
ncbi:MAG: hypothetical protein Q8M98_02310 [Candidatus Cloacimonadaceae bacterium]|nr:hypothetical protein [Candidatus Cloacimonadaceae bacterium]MDP3113588.1 hypothetical protein [Candidatus Cloacimonadaceae bacterium]